MRIGYASLALGVAGAAQHSVTLKTAAPENLRAVTAANLAALGAILEYNHKNNIRLFRISSDVIPFASHPGVAFPWAEEFGGTLAQLGKKAREYGIRLSMHPGQYTVLNSPTPDVVVRAVEDLRYHCRLLDLMGMDASCKIILHVGGAYGDKPAALHRFAQTYHRLDEAIRRRLILENDDRIYNAEEVLALSETIGAPVVFDNLHNAVNPSGQKREEWQWVAACAATWGKADGTPKVHYSQQAAGKKTGSHSATIDAAAFLEFAAGLRTDVDVMLEVKDKNLSAVKCILCAAPKGHIRALENEWALYKYAVLEYSPAAYAAIRHLLKEKNAYPAVPFYALVDEALREQPGAGNRINAAQHVWGYFKQTAGEKEKARFETLLRAFAEGRGRISGVKKFLYRLAEKYNQPYLLASYYFLFE